VRLGPGDDAAILRDGTAVTVDTLIEGIHWDGRLSAEDVGFKVLAVSVSDLAAMGATPEWALLALSLPDPLDMVWVDAFGRGFAAAAERWGVSLVGGDTTRSPGPRFASATVGGPAPAHPLTRGGAAPGDDLWVTGPIGLAGAGWAWESPGPAALAALRRPDPPVALARALVGIAAAAMDLSDGLSQDLPRLCAASGVGAAVWRAALPGHPELGADPWEVQLAGGDDYQLLFAAGPSRRAEVQAVADRIGRSIARIGELTADRNLTLDGDPWPARGFLHFGGVRA
jgi:thiamine-monophosphate kinase